MAKSKTEKLENEDFKKRTGIDLEKYRTQDILESVEGIVGIPGTFTFNLFFWPIFLAILLLGLGVWWIYTGSYFLGILWVVFGLILGPLTGLALGNYFTANRITTDSKNAFEAVLDTMDKVIVDLKANKESMPPDQALPKITDWIHAIYAIVLMPVVLGLIRRKIPFVGGWVASIVFKMLERTKALAIGSIKEERLAEGYEHLDAYIERMTTRNEKLRLQSSNTVATARLLTVAPLKTVTLIMFVIDFVVFGMLLYYMN